MGSDLVLLCGGHALICRCEEVAPLSHLEHEAQLAALRALLKELEPLVRGLTREEHRPRVVQHAVERKRPVKGGQGSGSGAGAGAALPFRFRARVRIRPSVRLPRGDGAPAGFGGRATPR